MKKKLILVCLCLVLSLALVAGCGGNQGAETQGTQGGTVTMMYTHGLGFESAEHWVALRFQELAYEFSNGRIVVQIFPADQLGSEQRGFQDVQERVVQASAVTVNNITPFAPSVGFMDLPFIFHYYQEFYDVIDEVWDELNERMIVESGNKAIAWYRQGFRNLTNSVRPVETLEDLRGLRIRVPPNPMMLAAFESWGTNATPIAWGETFTALQYGIIDGQENTHTVFNSMHFYETQRYLTEIRYKLWIGGVVVNNQWFLAQDQDIQEAILRAGRQVSLEMRDHIEIMEGNALANMLANGMINNGPPRDEELWMELAIATWPDLYDHMGGTAMLERAFEIIDRDRP